MQDCSDYLDLSIVKAEPIETSENVCLDHWADLEVQEDPAEEVKEQKENNQPVDENQLGWPNMWFKCRLCMYRSQTQDLLLNHMVRKHTLVDMVFYLCGFCNYKGLNEILLKEHLQEHMPTEKEVDDSWKWNLYSDYMEEESKIKRQRRNQRRDQRRNQRRLSRDQTKVLEDVFKRHHYINRKTRAELAAALCIEEGQVSSWFSNRRHKLMKYQYMF